MQAATARPAFPLCCFHASPSKRRKEARTGTRSVASAAEIPDEFPIRSIQRVRGTTLWLHRSSLINGRHATSHCHQVSFLALHETQPEVSWNLRRPTSSLRVYWYAVHRSICIRRHRNVRIYPVKMQHVRMFLCVAGVLIV